MAQRCAQCLETEYIVFPDAQECQLCPRGLQCRGDDVVELKVPGSVWDEVDGVYYLVSCPPGYLLENNSTLVKQQCVGCPVGLECTVTTGLCRECTPCPPGYYKETLGPELCEPCDRDTFNPDYGATSVAECRACPQYASTQQNASTQASDCVCAESTYIIEEPNSTGPICRECPIGAECVDSPGGVCALRYQDLVCPGGDRIVGNWSRISPVGEFRLGSCPSGSSLVNSLDGTSTGPFWHGSQQCVKCKPGDAYNLNPNSDPCQRCPPGS